MLLVGKSTISMAIFNSCVCLPKGIWNICGIYGFEWSWYHGHDCKSYVVSNYINIYDSYIYIV